MARIMKSCLQLSLKLVNSTIGIVGIAMIMYGLWMIRVWQRDAQGSSPDDHYVDNFPWFIHAFLCMGITLCAITCLGHVAADTANTCCLSCYMVFILLLLLSETAFIADVFLNSEWEKDLPDDPSGRFNDFRDFVKSNIDICQWIALLILLAQGCSVLLATVLRTVGTNKGIMCDSDDEYAQPRYPPLLNQPAAETLATYFAGEPLCAYNNEAWMVNK